MTDRRRSKKTDTIEVRVSPELKSEVGRLGAARGQTMSEVIRELVDRELARPVETETQTGNSLMSRFVSLPLARVGILGASVLGLALAYSFAGQMPALASVQAEARMTFAELDRNGDDVITPEEYARQIAKERTAEPWEPEIIPAACAGTFIEEEIAEETAKMTAPPEDLAEEHFAFLDSDRDGAVAFAELEAFLLAERAREFLEVDEDGNGFVTLDEVREQLRVPSPEEEAAWLAEDGLSEPCIQALLEMEVTLDEETEDPRLFIAEFDGDRDGRVGLLEFLEH